MRDVVVVGAGPAGSSTAYELAKRGRDVAVYEKRQEIGAPKRCGEGLSSNTIERLSLDIPDNCKRKSINGAVVYSPNFDMVNVDFGRTVGWILERKAFDKWMAQRAADAGAKVRAKTTITGLLPDNEGVVGFQEGERFEEEARMVVAADGVESVIARKTGIKGPSQLNLVDAGYQYEMAGIDTDHPHKIVLYFGEDIAPRGYVWIFPKGEGTANVGIGIHGGDEKSAKYYLDKFIDEHEELRKGSVLEVNSGMIPVGGFLETMVAENCLAVGDAANQVNPIHGGGMGEGIEAGRMAAGIIDKALEEGDTSKENLKEYDNRWWDERGERLVKAENIRKVIEEVDDDDLNFLAKELEGDDLIEFSHGKRLTKLGKILIKRPGLVGLARKLM